MLLFVSNQLLLGLLFILNFIIYGQSGNTQTENRTESENKHKTNNQRTDSENENHIGKQKSVKLTISLLTGLLQHGLLGLLDHNGLETGIVHQRSTTGWISVLCICVR